MDVNFERFARGLTDNLEAPVRKHLKNVYASFTLASLTACVGGYVHMFSSILGAGIMTSLAAIAMLVWLMSTPDNGKNQKSRLALLGGFSFLTGLNLGPLLQIAAVVNETLILQALFGTGLIFACFSLAALYAPRGHYLYLGGMLMSVLSTLMWLSFMNIFLGSTLIYQVNLYIGLAMMCGFVVYDTQTIIEKCRHGDKDYVMHSILLFIDFVSIFKKILIILTNKDAQSKKKRRD